MTADAASHPLDGPRGKLVRAVQQATFLVEHCEAYGNGALRLAPRFENGAHYVYLEGDPPPLYLGLILGEIVHDLRSALDQLAWQLALLHEDPEVLEDPRVGNAIYFPITYSIEKFETNRTTPHLSAEAAALIESRQPYHNDGLALVNPLAILHAWSNDDKHRSLTPSLGQLSMDDVAFQADAVIDINDVKLLAPDSSVIDRAEPLLRIPAPEQAHIVFSPIPVRVCFLSHVTGVADILHAAKVPQLCEEIAGCISSFEPMFTAVDWSGRATSWTTPELPA
jgi:hypothetical protein